MSNWKPKTEFTSHGYPYCPHCGHDIWNLLKDSEWLVNTPSDDTVHCQNCETELHVEARIEVYWDSKVIVRTEPEPAPETPPEE